MTTFTKGSAVKYARTDAQAEAFKEAGWVQEGESEPKKRGPKPKEK